MISAADEFYTLVAMGDFEQLPAKLDDESLAFYQAITKDVNLNFDSIYTIGQTFKVPYGALNFLMDFGQHMKNGADPSEFFKFLVIEDVSYFGLDGIFDIQEDKYKLGSEPMMGLSRQLNNQKSLTWMRLTPQHDKTYKVNILYNLRLHEYKFIERYKKARNQVEELSTREWLQLIYDQTGENKVDLTDLNRSILKKRETFHELHSR